MCDRLHDRLPGVPTLGRPDLGPTLLLLARLHISQSIFTGPVTLFLSKTNEISKIQDGGGRHLEKSKIEISRQRFDRSAHHLA